MATATQTVFKNYDQNQLMLLPPSLEELVAKNHPCRTVNQVIERIDISPLLARYEGGGTTSYHPKMLLKVLVYGYLSNIYSSRKIEAAIKENIHFMWLAAMNQPDHNTINRFRSEKLSGALKQVFKQIVLLLAEQGLVDIKEGYTDGTKIEANANRYTFVWGKGIKTKKEKIQQQLDALWNYARQVAKEELADTAPTSYEEINAEQVQKTIEKIDQALKDKPVEKKVKQKISYARKNWPQALAKYQSQEEILQGRNSYCKTDTDATFMRLKDDHMQNGQLKPAYNWQITTQNQIITNYTIHPNPTDTTTLIPHLEEYKQLYGESIKSITADSGYGSEENYQYLQDNEIDAYVKYNYFHQEQRNQNKKDAGPFSAAQLYYNEAQDCFYCPMGQPMQKKAVTKRTTQNGYEQEISIYEAKNCHGCPLRGVCHKAKGNRQIQVNHNLQRLKAQAREKLLSEEGIKHRKKRPADVEAVFGNIKSNHHFKRFMLRGKEKVNIEAGLIAIAHNLRKMAA